MSCRISIQDLFIERIIRFSMRNKYAVIFILLFAHVSFPVAAQDNVLNNSLFRTRPVFKISAGGNLQNWSNDGSSVQQTSFPLSLNTKILPGLGLNFDISQAAAEADDMTSIQGLSDLHISTNYTYPFSMGELGFSLGVAAPVGSQQFTNEEFETVSLLRKSQFNFFVPFYSQGLSISPGLSVVTILTDKIVLNAGFSYLIRGGFEPVEGLLDEYQLGNEARLNLGGGVQVAPGLLATFDGVFTIHAGDKIAESIVFEAGRQYLLNLGLMKKIGVQTLGVNLRHRGYSGSPVSNSFVMEGANLRAIAGFSEVNAYFSTRLGQMVSLMLFVTGTQFEEDASFEEMNLFGGGASADIFLTKTLSVPLYVKYTDGDLSGIEGGIGFAYIF